MPDPASRYNNIKAVFISALPTPPWKGLPWEKARREILQTLVKLHGDELKAIQDYAEAIAEAKERGDSKTAAMLEEIRSDEKDHRDLLINRAVELRESRSKLTGT